MITLSRSGMDDASLSDLLNNLPPLCIVLIEDIDAAFRHSITTRQTPEDCSLQTPEYPVFMGSPRTRLTLSGLLNAIDGLGAQEGRIMFATTNHIEALDPALICPGRMDLHIEFKFASKYQAEELFTRFYVPSPSASDDDESEDEEDDIVTLVDGDHPQILVEGVPVDVQRPARGSKVRESVSSAGSDSAGHLTHVNMTGLGQLQTSLSSTRIGLLAKQFAKVVPEGQFSMASLQGHLMNYKTDPLRAVMTAPDWVNSELEKRCTKEARFAADISS